MITIETPTYYTATKKYNLSFPCLEQDIDADVVIIGGGFSGINTALELAEKGITNIVVLEARYLGFGGTGRNGGQIMAGIGHDLEKIKRKWARTDCAGSSRSATWGPASSRTASPSTISMPTSATAMATWASTRVRPRPCRPGKRLPVDRYCPRIRFLGGSDVKQIIGSNAYSSALLHMGGGHVHSLNLLLGEAKALAGHGVRIFENSPALEVSYGERISVRTGRGSVRASKLLWACDSFLNKLEPELHRSTINTYAFQMMTEPLPEQLIQRISPIRGAYSDIRPVIDYYRVTNENRLLFGAATPLVEHIPRDLKAWNHHLMLKIFPYLKDVKIDLAWGGPMACSPNLFPQVGTLPGRSNAFYVQGYSGFGVTPSHIICKVLAEGMSEGSARYDLLSSIRRPTILGKDAIRPLLLTAGKSWHQLSGYWNGSR